MTLIDRYCRNQLDQAELSAFKARMSSDTAFKAAVLLHAQAVEAIKLEGRALLKKRLQQRSADEKHRPKYLLYILAGALSILLVGVIWWAAHTFSGDDHATTPSVDPDKLNIENTQKGPDTVPAKNNVPQVNAPVDRTPSSRDKAIPPATNTEKIFASNFEPYTDPVIGRLKNRANTDGLSATERFVTAYANGDYAKTISLFEELDPGMKAADRVLLIYGNALLASGRADAAAVNLNRIIEGGNEKYMDDATWYLALCRLKQGQLASAKSLLQTLVSKPVSGRSQGAAQVLENL